MESILGKLLTPQEREEKYKQLREQEEEEGRKKMREHLAQQQKEYEGKLKQDILDYINVSSTKVSEAWANQFDAFKCSDEFLKNIEKELLEQNYKMSYRDDFLDIKSGCSSFFTITPLSE